MKGLKPLSQYLCRKRRLEVNLKKLKEIKRNYWVQLQFNQVTLAVNFKEIIASCCRYWKEERS